MLAAIPKNLRLNGVVVALNVLLVIVHLELLILLVEV